MTFLLADNDHATIFEYLYDREMISDAYRPVVKTVHLSHGDSVRALTFVSRRDHRQYAAKMNTREIVSIVRAAQGPKGSNTDYILNTVQHLDEMGILKTELHKIARQL